MLLFFLIICYKMREMIDWFFCVWINSLRRSCWDWSEVIERWVFCLLMGVGVRWGVVRLVGMGLGCCFWWWVSLLVRILRVWVICWVGVMFFYWWIGGGWMGCIIRSCLRSWGMCLSFIVMRGIWLFLLMLLLMIRLNRRS